MRCSDTCNNVLALCVCQVFAIEFVFACGGVSCERYARSTVVAHVTEDHCLDVYGCTVVVVNFVVVSICYRARDVP